jgi:RHS repeat-associated protein
LKKQFLCKEHANNIGSVAARILLFAVFLLVAIATPARAQDETPTAVTVQNRAGDLPFSAAVGTDIEHVDVTTGDLVVHIPLASVKGRGLDFNYGLRYDARYWAAGTRQLTGHGPTQVWNIALGSYVAPGTTPGLGWQSTQARLSWVNTKISCSVTMPQTMFARFQSHYIYYDAEGGAHPLGVRYGVATCDTESYTLNDLNGPDLNSGIYARMPAFFKTPNIYDASGSQVAWSENGGTFVPPPQMINTGNLRALGTVEDSNGNTIQQFPGGLDTLGRTIVTQVNGTNQIFYKIYDSSGTQQTYTVNFGTISLATSFAASDLYGAIQEYTGGRSVITSIVLPNGKSYLFQYETGGFGALTRIDLPTGAYVTYTWGTIYNSGNGDSAFRYVSSRTLHTDGQTFTWNFSLVCPTTDAYSGVICTNTVTDPLNEQTVYNVSNGSVTTAKVYNGSATGTPVRQYDLTYTGASDFYGVSPGTGQLLTGVTTTLDGALVSKKEFDYNDFASSLWSECDESNPQDGCPVDNNTGLLIQDAGTMPRGNVTEIREFDWGTAPHGPLLRRTKFTYQHNSDTNYVTYNIVNKVASTTVCNGVVSCAGTGDQSAQTQYEYDNYVAGDNPQQSTTNAAQHDYTIYASTFKYRGNATRVKRWRNTDGSLLTTTYTYDDLGNIRGVKDPLSHSTTFNYTDSFANSSCLPPSGKNGQAYVSTVTNPLSQQMKVVRYPCTALVQAHQDQNDINAARAGTTYTYDLLGRPTAKNLPDGGQTTTAYNDVPPVSSTATTKINSTQNLIVTSVEDGLGRAKESQITSDPQGTVFTDTSYDGLGRVFTRSNPYRSGVSPTDGTTTYFYDALGRPCLVVPPDGTLPTGSTCPATSPSNDVFTTYSGNTTTVTDQAGKSRKSVSDGLGNLAQVFEDPAVSNYETDYAYDALSNLLTVNQKGGSTNSNWRTRTFTYDSLSRLTQAVNPESGTTSYAYDPNGNLTQKTSPKPNQTGTLTLNTTYTYDALNRLGCKTYDDGTPHVCFNYDEATVWETIANPIGHVTSMGVGTVNAAEYSYDPMGRPVTFRECDPSNCGSGSYNTFYTYDLAGDMTSVANGAGVTLTYAYDGAARPAKVTSSWSDAQHPSTLYTVDPSHGYFPNGALRAATLANGLTNTAMYNNRLQPCRGNLNSVAGVFVTCSDGVPSPGNLQDFNYSFTVSSANNGNLASITAVGNQAFSRAYTYDTLNRLGTMNQSSGTATGCSSTYSLSWTYDAWGNRTDQNLTGTGGSCGTFHATVNTNNWLVDPINNTYQYDAAGNMTHDASHSYTYDAENHLISVDGGATASYVYDALGKRVRKNTGSTWAEYVYDISGNVLAENNPAGWNSEYVYVNGQLIAQYRNNTTYSVFSDHLGSTRLVTGMDKSISQNLDYLPYGELNSSDSGTTSHKFTGKERDSESGLDNFGARYDSSSMGRFMSPDPLLNSGLPWNPQSWNRYSYTENNPLRYTDPTGLFKWGKCQILENCEADKQRFRDSLKKLKDAAAGLPENSDEKKKLDKLIKKIGEEGKWDIKVGFGDAGTTNGQPNLGRTVGNTITINYTVVNHIDYDFHLNESETAALDAGLTAHEGAHAGNAPGAISFLGMHGEHAGYFAESLTYQGLHNTDRPFQLWNESWLTVDKDKISLERDREHAIQNAIHPPKEQKQENPQ